MTDSFVDVEGDGDLESVAVATAEIKKWHTTTLIMPTLAEYPRRTRDE